MGCTPLCPTPVRHPKQDREVACARGGLRSRVGFLIKEEIDEEGDGWDSVDCEERGASSVQVGLTGGRID